MTVREKILEHAAGAASPADGALKDHEAEISAMLDRGEEAGCLDLSEVSDLIKSLDLSEERSGGLFRQIGSRGIDDHGRLLPRGSARGHICERTAAGVTTDALRLFLNEISRHDLLTAEEEVDLAKRIERGDDDAKTRMINSNLRLVVAMAKRTRPTTWRCST